MSKAHIAIAVCLVHLFGVDQDQPPHAEKGKLLNDVRPQATDANNGNAGCSKRILPTLTKEANITVILLAIRDKG